MTRARIIFRRVRTLLWTALTLVILLAAMLVGVGKLLMPYSTRYQPQLEAWLTREFKQPVVVDSFTGEWKAFGPRISLEGVTLMGDGQGEGEIAIQHAALDIKPLNALLPHRPLYSFRIIGADLSLVRAPDGRFELSGLGVSGRSNGDGDASGLRSLTTVGEVRLEDSSLSFDDEDRDIHVQLTGMRGRLQLNGLELSTELEADISDQHRTRVLGDLKATALITLGEDQRLSSARWHVKTGELMIEELSRQLPYHTLIPRSGWLNAEIWGDWSQGSAQLMEGVVDLRDSTLSERPRLLQLDHLNARFRWHFTQRKVWRMDLSDLTVEQGGELWQSPRMSIERNIPGNLGLWISSDFLDIEFPMELTQRVMTSYNTRWPGLMPRRARGTVHGFDLVLDGFWKLYAVQGAMDKVDAWEWERYPDIAGINGSLSLQGGEGEIFLGGQDVRLDWPKNFRRQAVVDIPACTMEILWGKPGQWRIDARDCLIENDFFSMRGRARFAGNEGKPAMDINMVFDRAALNELDDYWPQSVLSPKVVSWLRRGIVEGQAGNGRFSLRGDMDDWPFREGQGLLLSTARIEGASIDYYPGWPRARGIDVDTRFRNTAMDATGSVGNMAGVGVQQVTARVEDFKNAVLELDYRSSAPLPDLVNVIGQTPMLDNVDLDLDQFGFGNPAETSGHLTAPLKAGLGTVSIDGRLTLADNVFTELKSGIQLTALSGDIHYDREGMTGNGLAGRFRDLPAKLSLEADWEGDEVFSAGLSGHFPVDAMLPSALLETEPMLHKFQGSTGWDVRLAVARDAGSGDRETWLEIFSGLEGVSMEFPVPLAKPAETSWPLVVRYPVKAANPVMSIKVNDQAMLQFEQGRQLGAPQRANIHFGPGSGELPEQGYFTLGGSVHDFDMDGWMDLVIERFSEQRPGQGLVFDRADLTADDLQFLNRSFPGVDLEVRYEDGILFGNVDSASMSGAIRYSRSEGGAHSLTAEMERLFMPAPVNEGMAMDTDPSSLPEMHLYARQFSYMGLELGETRIEAFPVQNGLRFDSIESESPQMNFRARGDWVSDVDGVRSDFDIMLTSESLGSMIEMMDISSVLEGGQTMLHYDAWWPGPPAAFAMASLNGEMNISVVDGKIMNADAGAGRIVGLLSVAALPRRLALDFRDVFGSGFSFDQATGTITLEHGQAFTDDLVLESTAATMAITGTSDLDAKEFDYVMAVRPGVSQTLPAIGAVIGGPGGAAAGLALSGLLRKSLGEATEALYTIRGPWSSPAVEPVKTLAPVTEPVTEEEGTTDE